MSRPLGNTENALTSYFRECRIPASDEVKEFSNSGAFGRIIGQGVVVFVAKRCFVLSIVQKLKVATNKYGEMMTSYRVKEELEDWLAKLGEIKVSAKWNCHMVGLLIFNSLHPIEANHQPRQPSHRL